MMPGQKVGLVNYNICLWQFFRSVENRVPSVRATASGETVIIDPNGRITSSIPAFEENYLVGEIPLIDDLKITLYTKFGDYVGVFFTIFAFGLLIGGGVNQIIIRCKKGKHNNEK